MKNGSIITLWAFFLIGGFAETIGTRTPQTLKKRIGQIEANIDAEIREEGMVPATPSRKVPDEYLNLFNHLNPVSKSKLKFDQTLTFKFRYPVSDFIYNGRYLIQLYKIGYVGNTSLNTVILKTDKNFMKIQSDLPYALNQQGLFDFMYCTYTRSNPSIIHLDIFGNKTKVLTLNDTIAYYNSNLKNLTIRYNKNESKDIFIKANTSGISYTSHDLSRFAYTRPVPFETLFLKRGGELYLIMMSGNNPKVNLQPGMLLNVLEGRGSN